MHPNYTRIVLWDTFLFFTNYPITITSLSTLGGFKNNQETYIINVFINRNTHDIYKTFVVLRLTLWA